MPIKHFQLNFIFLKKQQINITIQEPKLNNALDSEAHLEYGVETVFKKKKIIKCIISKYPNNKSLLQAFC